jgi:hypothetical protein
MAVQDALKGGTYAFTFHTHSTPSVPAVARNSPFGSHASDLHATSEAGE